MAKAARRAKVREATAATLPESIEGLGVFYLGRTVDPASGAATAEAGGRPGNRGKVGH